MEQPLGLGKKHLGLTHLLNELADYPLWIRSKAREGSPFSKHDATYQLSTWPYKPENPKLLKFLGKTEMLYGVSDKPQ